MRIQSLLNNKSVKKVFFFGFILIISIGIHRTKKEDVHTVQNAYHLSRWNSFAPEIERYIKVPLPNGSLQLQHIYGGVVSHHIPTTIKQLVEFYGRLKQKQDVKN